MKLAQSMSNSCRIRYPKFRVDVCNGFGVIAKIREGAVSAPPPPAGRWLKEGQVNDFVSGYFEFCTKRLELCVGASYAPTGIKGLSSPLAGDLDITIAVSVFDYFTSHTGPRSKGRPCDLSHNRIGQRRVNSMVPSVSSVTKSRKFDSWFYRAMAVHF